MHTIKDRSCSAFSGTPFRKIPGIVTIALVMASVLCIHVFPTQDDVSPTLIPRSIIAGLDIYYNLHCTLEFGEYVQVHNKGENTMMERSTGAISFYPVCNAQIMWHFLSLTMGWELKKRK